MNTDQQIKHIEKLLRCFFDGTTTHAEEKELYAFFAQDDVPQQLAPYRPVFQYFDTGIVNEFKAVPLASGTFPGARKKNRILWFSIAASFLLIISATSLYTYSQKPFNPYEGSYIVRNGKRITTPEEIEGELEKTIRQVNHQQQEAQNLVESIHVQRGKMIHIEVRVKAQHKEILDNFEDEQTRKIVKDILGG